MIRYRMREAGTGRELGVVELADPVPHGELVLRFRRGEILVEPLPVELAVAHPNPAPVEERKGRRARRATP